MAMMRPSVVRVDDACPESMDYHIIDGDGISVVLSEVEVLPPDVMNAIFSFLVLDDLAMVSSLSKRLYNAISGTNHLYMCESERLSNSESRLTETGMRKLLQRFRGLNILRLHGLASVGDNLFDIINESPTANSLHQISLHGCHLSYWCQSSLNLQNLTHFKIMGGSIRVSFGSFVTASSPNLKSLMIGQCSSLRDENVNDLCDKLRNQLETLALHQCLRVRKPKIHLSKLKSVSLVGCYSLENLPEFDCPALESLDLSFCFRLCGKVMQQVVNSCPSLKNLTLTKCPLLQNLFISSSTLETLNVSLNNNLRSLRLSCCRLNHLEVRPEAAWYF